jgi:hypothetical protein
MIGIKLHNERNWRININEENWEFKDKAELFKCLNELLILKEKYGKLKNDK